MTTQLLAARPGTPAAARTAVHSLADSARRRPGLLALAALYLVAAASARTPPAMAAAALMLAVFGMRACCRIRRAGANAPTADHSDPPAP